MIIEVRPIIEKQRLKSKTRELKRHLYLRKTHKVPHLTLIYNFRPDNIAPHVLGQMIASVARKYGRLRYRYDGFEIKKGKRGYVLAFKIMPSIELRKFRYDLYKTLKSHILEDTRTSDFNQNGEEDYWFHAAIAFQMDINAAKRAEKFINKKSSRPMAKGFLGFFKSVEQRTPNNHPIIDSEVVRIPIIMDMRIAYEYDTLLGKVLNRKEALSGEYTRQTLSKYRELENIEVKNTAHKSKPATWLLSDTHFYHEPIIRMASRPFYDIREMNNILVSNWNNTISQKDLVYFLGDLALGRDRDPPKRAKPDLTQMFADKLNGKKVFINGNHDPESFGEKSKIIEYKGIKFMLVHDPKDAQKFDGWVIHGHTHNNDLVNTPFINFEKKTINVSVELIGYKPINFDTIVNLITESNKDNILYYKE